MACMPSKGPSVICSTAQMCEEEEEQEEEEKDEVAVKVNCESKK